MTSVTRSSAGKFVVAGVCLLAVVAVLATVFLLLPGLYQVTKPGRETGRVPSRLEQFRNLSPAERLRLIAKLPRYEKLFDKVDRGPVLQTVVERGQVVAAENHDVVCRVKNQAKEGSAGPIATRIKWVIEEGAAVKEGDRLVELDDSALREKLLEQKSRQEQAEAAQDQASEALTLLRKETPMEIRLAEIAVQLAEAEAKKQTEAERKDSGDLKVEQAKLLLERTRLQVQGRETQAQTELRVRQALLEQEKAKVREIEEQINRCTLTAPQTGIVAFPDTTRIRSSQPIIAVGEQVREGQLLVRIPDLSRFVIATRINEAQIARVKVGQPVLVRVDANPRKELAGKVTQVANAASEFDFLMTDVRVFPAQVALPGEDNFWLRPGMSAEVRIKTHELPDALRIPASAVLQRRSSLDIDPKGDCFVRTAEGIQEREVRLGVRGDPFVEVLDGLTKGEDILRDPRAVLGHLDLESPPGERAPAEGRGQAGLKTDLVVRSIVPERPNEFRRNSVTSYGLTHADQRRIAEFPYVMELVPLRAFPQVMRRLDAVHIGTLVATTPAFAEGGRLNLALGRFLNDQDEEEFQNVAVLGSAVADALFPDQEPLDQTIRLGNQYFRVVGLFQEQTEPALGLPADQINASVYVPLSTCQARYGSRITLSVKGSRRTEAFELSSLVVTVPLAQAAGTRNAIQALLQESHKQKDWDVR